MWDWLTGLFGTASDFAGDAYGWITNEIGHVSAGLVLFFVVWRVLAVFMSNHAFIALIASSGAYFAFEIIVQGWQGSDTIADWAFVTLGALVATQIRVKSLMFFTVAILSVIVAAWARYELGV